MPEHDPISARRGRAGARRDITGMHQTAGPMRTLTEWLRLNMRICLAATLVIEAAIGLLPQLENCTLPSVVGTLAPSFELHSTALSALYFVMSVWLMLGIRTSLLAAAAAVLLIAPAIIAAPDGNPALAVKITLVAVFSLPLILWGGGRYTVLEPREQWMLDEDDEHALTNALRRNA
jgi:hypothetical protein